MISDNLPKKIEIIDVSMEISSISTGFIEIPSKISLNIYVQGCKLCCEGCQNPDLQPFTTATTIKLSDLPNILHKRDLPTWICWLGGDATYQPDGFLSFNTFFKEKNYKICLYTGKEFSEIENLLENVDLVIDGPWKGKKIDEIGTNQGIFLKTDNKWDKISYNQLKEIK